MDFTDGCFRNDAPCQEMYVPNRRRYVHLNFIIGTEKIMRIIDNPIFGDRKAHAQLLESLALIQTGVLSVHLALQVVAELPSRVHVLYEYFDGTLGLREKMEDALIRMTPRQFERVLHPVFEEDELTLTLSGGALGAAAGVLQTALS